MAFLRFPKPELQALLPLLWQMRRFVVVGIVNTLFGYLVYAAGILCGLDYTPALVLSYVVGVTFSYFTFRHFVFEQEAAQRTKKRRSFTRFLATYLFLFMLNWAALYGLVTVGGWGRLQAQAIIVPCCAALSFVINRLFVFRAGNADKAN